MISCLHTEIKLMLCYSTAAQDTTTPPHPTCLATRTIYDALSIHSQHMHTSQVLAQALAAGTPLGNCNTPSQST
jgi:hypothetical protein